MGDMDEILNEDTVKGDIDELCEDIKDFGQVDFIHLAWCKKGENAKGRYYGEVDTILAALSKTQFLILMRETEVDDE